MYNETEILNAISKVNDPEVLRDILRHVEWVMNGKPAVDQQAYMLGLSIELMRERCLYYGAVKGKDQRAYLIEFARGKGVELPFIYFADGQEKPRISDNVCVKYLGGTLTLSIQPLRKKRLPPAPTCVAPSAAPIVIESAAPVLHAEKLPEQPSTVPVAVAAPAVVWRCLPLKPGVKPLDQRPEVLQKSPAAYQPGQLMHPAIKGLMLSLDERLYGLCLEMTDDKTGETRLESVQEKGFRIRWKETVPMTPSATCKSFVTMDMSLFKKQP